MGHIAHLRKQFKSINTHDYIITLIKRRRRNIINLIKRIFLISWMYFLLFRNYLPLEKGRALHLNKLESPSPKEALCQVWLKSAQWFWDEDENLKSLQTDGRTDRQTDGWKVIRKAHLSFQLRWANKNEIVFWLWPPSMSMLFMQDLSRIIISFWATMKSMQKPKDLVQWSIITWEKIKECNKTIVCYHSTFKQ